jgi:hypothetical protein
LPEEVKKMPSITPNTQLYVVDIPVGTANYLPILPQFSTSTEVRQNIIAKAAYFKAQQRGFAPGHELDDWLAAEQDLHRPLPFV